MWGFLATFFNGTTPDYGGVTVSLDIMQTKRSSCSIWQDILPASPWWKWYMQEWTPSSKWWKWLPSQLVLKLTLWKWQSQHQHVIACFTLVVTQMKNLFFMSQNKFNLLHTCPASCKSPDNLCSSAWISIIRGWSWLSTTNVCISLFTSILQSRYNSAVSSHLFSFSAVQHSHRNDCCQQKHRCSTAAHDQQHFQAPTQEFV